MAKSATHKLLTEILYGIKKLIYIRFIDNTKERTFSSTATISDAIYAKFCGRFLKGNQDTSRAPKNNKQPCSCQTSLRNLLFHLVQRISLHFKSPDLYLFSTTKVIPKFLLPFESQASFQSEEFGSYDYAPLLLSLVACFLSSLSAHAQAKKDPCCMKYFISSILFVFITGAASSKETSDASTQTEEPIGNVN